MVSCSFFSFLLFVRLWDALGLCVNTLTGFSSSASTKNMQKHAFSHFPWHLFNALLHMLAAVHWAHIFILFVHRCHWCAPTGWKRCLVHRIEMQTMHNVSFYHIFFRPLRKKHFTLPSPTYCRIKDVAEWQIAQNMYTKWEWKRKAKKILKWHWSLYIFSDLRHFTLHRRMNSTHG